MSEKNAPARIWLQLDLENDQPLEDATWCSDQIEDYDTEYRRADLPPTPAEARVAELEAEVERMRTALGAEQDSADEMADVLSACGDGLMFDVDRLQAALDQHDALREASLSSIPMPADAAAALDRLTAQARAQGMREAAMICCALIKAAGNAGLQDRQDGMRDVSDAVLSRAEEIEKEARNG